MTVNLERLINHTGVLEDLCPKYFDLVLLVRVISLVHRVQEGLAVKLDASLDRRIDSSIDRSAQLFDTGKLVPSSGKNAASLE
jgi:hypothetical protein